MGSGEGRQVLSAEPLGRHARGARRDRGRAPGPDSVGTEVGHQAGSGK